MKVYIVTWPNGYFGNSDKSWKSLNTQTIANSIDYSVYIVSINEILNIKFDKHDVVILNCALDESMRKYIKSIAYFLDKKCHIIPSYDLILAYEDKGVQELIKSEKNIGNLVGNYFFDIDDSNLEYPKVLKTISGAGSNGVYLVKNDSDLNSIRRKYFSNDVKRKLIKAQRKLKLSKDQYKIYDYRFKGFNNFVEQKFIPNLDSDYKVLVFGDRYFVLKRSVRKNDFRASGSGLFEFVEAPIDVLEFALDIHKKLPNPVLSLDIAKSESGCHLIEFQATNFGPYTLLNAPYRYIFTEKKDRWHKEENCKNLELNFAYAINWYIKNLNILKVYN